MAQAPCTITTKQPIHEKTKRRNEINCRRNSPRKQRNCRQNDELTGRNGPRTGIDETRSDFPLLTAVLYNSLLVFTNPNIEAILDSFNYWSTLVNRPVIGEAALGYVAKEDGPSSFGLDGKGIRLWEMRGTPLCFRIQIVQVAKESDEAAFGKGTPWRYCHTAVLGKVSHIMVNTKEFHGGVADELPIDRGTLAMLSERVRVAVQACPPALLANKGAVDLQWFHALA
jgi:hypothetical protein